MTTQQKTVLMLQPSERQKAIWYTVLTSQTTLVVQESSSADLYQNIAQAKDVGKLPELLLIDTGIPNLNPYVFCHSCREQQLDLKIILTDGTQNQVTSAERRWAIFQGAQDFLPGFQPETLLKEGVTRVNRVLEVLDLLPIQQEPLIPILLSLTSSNTASPATNSHQLNHAVIETKKEQLLPKSERTSNNSTSNKRRGHSYR